MTTRPRRAARPTTFTFAGAPGVRADDPQTSVAQDVESPERQDVQRSTAQDAATAERTDVQPSKAQDAQPSSTRKVQGSKRGDVKTAGRPEGKKAKAADGQGPGTPDGEDSGRISYTWRITVDQADQMDDLVRATRRRLGLRRLDRATVLQALVDAATENPEVQAALINQLRS